MKSMSTATTFTADQLWEMPDDGNRYELVSGLLRMMSPSGWRHGEIVGRLHSRLGPHIEKHKLGKAFGAETGFLISRDPDTVRAPDVAFIANENLPATDPAEAFWPGAPDLAVEVLSPSDKTGEVDEKIQAWLAARCRAVWVVDPKLQTVTACRSASDVAVLAVDQILEGGEVVQGFRCPVAEIFGVA